MPIKKTGAFNAGLFNFQIKIWVEPHLQQQFQIWIEYGYET